MMTKNDYFNRKMLAAGFKFSFCVILKVRRSL